MLSKEGEIRRDEACLDYAGSDPILYPCHGSKGNQYWEYEHAVSSYFLSVFVHMYNLRLLSCRHGHSATAVVENASPSMAPRTSS